MFVLATSVFAQQNSLSIGTNQINAKAVLWLVPNASGQGLLLPVVSTAVRNGMGLQAADRGMIVYDNTDNSVYLWNGTAWNNLAGGAATTFTGANGITVTGNTISTDAIRPTTNATGDLSGTFANPQIANNAITTAKIANDAVDNSKIANVNPAKLTQAAATNGQVLKWSGTAWAPADDLTAALTAGTGISIASNVITNTGLLTTSTAAGEVTGTFANLQIANGVVTDVKLADNSVTTAKIANNAVIASKIADGNVTTNKIADNAINTAKVQDANITTPKIADGAVTDAKLATGIAVNKLAPGTNGQVLTVAAGQASWQPAPSSSVPILANGQILTGNGTVNSPTTLTGDATLAAGALTIANNAVTTPKIANDAVTTAKILDANVTNAKLAPGIDAAKITVGTLPTARLNVGTTANQIVQLDGTGRLPAVDGSQLTNLPTSGGDITDVVAGTGLTGGATTGSATLNVNTGTGANQIVQLDGSGRLPAVDGSQLTNLPGDISAVVAGTGLTGGATTGSATLNVNTGTGANQIPQLDAAGKLNVSTIPAGVNANQIVQLDASGRLPAVDGSQLTGLAGGGDITGVTAGTGLTGGATSGDATLNVNVGTGANQIPQLDATGKLNVSTIPAGVNANQIVQLDGSGRLPAVDGSQLTNLPTSGGDITDVVAGTGLTGGATTGSATLNVNTGTGANQIVQLDGSGRLPAVDASQLTNLPAATETDPTVRAINGLVRSNGTTISAAVAGTDFLAPNGNGSALTNLNASNLSSGTLPPARIAAGDIDNSKLATGIDAAKISTGTLPGAVLPANVLLNSSTAGGELSGTLTALTINNNAVTTAKIDNGAVTDSKITDVSPSKIQASGASNGQVLKFNGSNWVPQPDDVGGGATPTLSNGQILVGNGTNNSATTLSGDATLAAGVLTIANDAVTTVKILDANVTDAKIAGVSASKLAGTVAVANGGTGLAATPGNGQLPIGNGTGYTLAPLTAGSGVNIVNGAGSITISATGGATDLDGLTDVGISGIASGQVLLHNGTEFRNRTLSGDIANVGPAGAVTIANDAITTAKILDANVTNAKLAANSVDASKIADGSITGLDLAGSIAISTSGNITAANFIGAGAGLSALNANNFTTGTLPVARGGTGSTTLPGNGQLLIGNGTGYTVAPITGGAGINVVNGAGSITISSTALSNPMTNEGDLIIGGTGGAPQRLGAGIGFLRGGPTPSYSAIDLATSDVNGTLPVGNGGTGLTSFGTGGLLYASDGTTLGSIGNGTAGQMLLVTGTTPTWQSMSGDGTLSPAGVFSLSTSAATGSTITNAINASTGSILGARVLPTFGAQNITTSGTLSAGNTTVSQLAVSGANTSINGATLTWPAANAAGVLANDGAGTLSWATGSGWGLTGNAGTNPATNFIGTTDAQPLLFKTGVGGVERMRIDATGNLGIGTGTPSSKLEVVGDVSATGALLNSNTNDAFGSFTVFRKSRAGGAVNANDELGYTEFQGHDGTAFRRAALIYGVADGAPSAGSVPGRLTFHTTPAGGTYLERMRITSTGDVGIGTTAPTERLDISGNLRFSGALMPNNLPGTAGQVLTSAGPGNAPTWSNAASGWGLGGNTGTVDGAPLTGTNYIGTRDNVALNFMVNSQRAGRIDQGLGNAFFGYLSGQSGPGQFNTGFGDQTLVATTIGVQNTAVGQAALRNTTSGNNNTAVGQAALITNTTGGFNTAVGLYALDLNTAGNHSTAVGQSALFNNTGSNNTAVGSGALITNTNGTGNTAIGYQADVGSAGLSNATAIGANAIVSQSNSVVLGNNANVGIGTTAPTARLHVNVASLSNFGLLVDNARDIIGGPIPAQIIGNTSGQTFGSNTQGRLLRLGNNSLQIYDMGIGSNGGFFLTRNNTYAPADFNISSAGNVGIGTASASARLDLDNAANGMRINGWFSAGSSIGGAAYVGTNLYRNYSDNTWRYTNTHPTIGGSAVAFNTVFPGQENDILFVRATTPGTANAAASVLESMRIEGSTGHVGIGTSNPSYPLEVSGSNTYLTSTGPFDWQTIFSSSGTVGGSQIRSISIRASDFVLATGFLATSDERIKRKIAVSDSRDDLSTLMKLKITDYKYTDSLYSGNVKVKGILAQELEKVYPESVSKQTNFIPNIYALANDLVYEEINQKLTLKLAKPHGLVVGDKVKLISNTGGEKPAVVSGVTDNTFTVTDWTEKSEKIFVFGKEVYDFRVVDYDRLFTLNISATQELAKMVEDQKKLIDELKAKDEESKKKIAVLEASLNQSAGAVSELSTLKSEIEKIKTALGMSADATKKQTPNAEEKK